MLFTMFGVIYCTCFFTLLVMKWDIAEGALRSTSCATVAELFAKRVGHADNVPLSPIPDAKLSVCAETLKYTGGISCCTKKMEDGFLAAAGNYLRDHVQMNTMKLKTGITQCLSLFQEHMSLTLQEAHRRTSDILATVYKIPKEVHKGFLDDFFHRLNSYVIGSQDYQLPNILDQFFKELFPMVFHFVLSDPTKNKLKQPDFHNCLISHYEQIDPFGNVPKHLGHTMKYVFQRARIFSETLSVMTEAIESVNQVEIDHHCPMALSHLQFCPMCSGDIEVRPCKGLCLNVMRGCLPQLAEISSSWDDLVVAFQNLELGMFKQSNAQDLLFDLNGNITDALLQAMDDGPRIYDDVNHACSGLSVDGESRDFNFKKFLTPAEPENGPIVVKIPSVRKDISGLIRQLEDTKGFLQRLADDLCRVPVNYDQDMQSHQCWNGSAVGKYMRSVPEVNVISQVQHNKEVTVSLVPIMSLIKVKDRLVHMRKNLSALFNEELMLSDQSYNSAWGSGNSNVNHDVIVDDEDLVDPFSGSGSGHDPVDEPEGNGEDVAKESGTTSNGNKGGNESGVKPGVINKPQSGNKKPNNFAETTMSAFTLIVASVVLGQIYSQL